MLSVHYSLKTLFFCYRSEQTYLICQWLRLVNLSKFLCGLIHLLCLLSLFPTILQVNTAVVWMDNVQKCVKKHNTPTGKRALISVNLANLLFASKTINIFNVFRYAVDLILFALKVDLLLFTLPP